MRLLPLLLFGSLTTFGFWKAAAQMPGAMQSQQVENAEQRRLMEDRAAALAVSNAPSLFPEEDVDVGPQSILKLHHRAPFLEIFADAQYFYTDNMFLSDENKQSADVLVSTIQGTFSAPAFNILGGTFVQRAGYRHQWFDYGLADHSLINVFDFQTATFRKARLNEFDFNAESFFADGTWKKDNWIAGISFDYRRLMDTDEYQQFYRELVPRWGLKRIVPLCSHSSVSVGYEGDYRATATDDPPPGFNSNYNDRTDHSLVLDGTVVLCQYAIAQAYYRFQYTYFTGSERRRDHLNTFGLALYCPLDQNIGLRFFGNYQIFKTDGALVTDYESLDAGMGLNLSVRF